MKKWLTLLFALFMLAVIILADRGTLPAPVKLIYQFPNGDRVGHLVLYGILTFLADAAFPCGVKIAGMDIFLGSLLVAALALLEEFSQIFIPSRTFDLVDLTFTMLGIAYADWLFHLIRRRQTTK